MSRLAPPLSVILFSFFFAIQLSAAVPSGAADIGPQQTYDCSTQRQVPQDECQALVDLYNSTDGPGWLNKTQWLSPLLGRPCDWFGVTCSDGHLIGLELPRHYPSGRELTFLEGRLTGVFDCTGSAKELQSLPRSWGDGAFELLAAWERERFKGTYVRPPNPGG